jgi:dynamin 1-like protein
VIAYFKKLTPASHKLVSDLINSEANYVNTAHPDFISGHQAMSIAQERLFPKPAQPNDQPSRGAARPAPQAPPLSASQKNLLGEPSAEDNGFFSSFWPGKKTQKKAGVLEPVPAILKASGNLSEREMLEMETISKLFGIAFTIHPV